MTWEAQNALLRVLEEPPGRTVFFLCFTDLENVQQTVLSRLNQITLSPFTIEDVQKILGVSEVLASISEGNLKTALALVGNDNILKIRKQYLKILENWGNIPVYVLSKWVDDIDLSFDVIYEVLSSLCGDLARVKSGVKNIVHKDLGEDISFVSSKVSQKLIMKNIESFSEAKKINSKIKLKSLFLLAKS
jgi:DNA polymerase-3 subunit delta'